MAEFEGRLDPEMMQLRNAKIIANTATGFDDDGAVSLFYKVALGLCEEAKQWIKDNALTYDGIIADFQNIDGTWRTIDLSYDTKLGGVVQRLEKGLYETIEWDYARLVTDQRRPAGTSDDPDDGSGNTEERYLSYEFKYIAPDAVDDAVAALETTKADIAVVDGTWYLIDAVGAKEDDGTYSIKALYANTSMYSLIGRDSYLLPGATKSYHYNGVPKQLAHTICALYNGTGDLVRPSYNGQGTVDITVARREVNTVELSGIVTENSCKFTESTSYTFGILDVSDLPDNSIGITYSQRVSRNSDGTYDVAVTKRTRIQRSTTNAVHASGDRTESETQSIGASTITSSLSTTTGHIKRRDVRINDDCTYDDILVDATITNQRGSGGTNAKLYTRSESVDTSSTSKSIGASSIGTIKSTKNTPTAEGRFHVEQTTDTSIEYKFLDGATELRDDQTDVTLRYVNKRVAQTIPTAQATGKLYSRQIQINQDGSFNTELKTVTVKDKENTSETDALTFEQSVLEHTSGEQVEAEAGPLGSIITISNEPTPQKTFRTKRTDETSKAVTIVGDDTAVTDKWFEKEHEGIAVNQRSVNKLYDQEDDEDPVEGVTLTRRITANRDGTVDISKRVNVLDRIDSTTDSTTYLNSGTLVTESNARNINSAELLEDVSTYEIVGDSAQGTTVKASKRRAVDGTWEVSKSTETERSITATTTIDPSDGDEGGQTKDRQLIDAETIILEERHSGATTPLRVEAAATEAVIIDQTNAAKPNGLFETMRRTTESILSTVVSYITKRDQAFSTSETSSKNIRAEQLYIYNPPAPAVGQTVIHKREKNRDGTHNTSTQIETELNQTATTETAWDRFIGTSESTTTEVHNTCSEAPTAFPSAATEAVIVEQVNKAKPNGFYETIVRSTESILSLISSYTSRSQQASTTTESVAKNIKSTFLNSYTGAASSQGTTISRRIEKNNDGTYNVINQSETEVSLSGSVYDNSPLKTSSTTITTGATEQGANDGAPSAGSRNRSESIPKENGLFRAVVTDETAIEFPGEEVITKNTALYTETSRHTVNATAPTSASYSKGTIGQSGHRINEFGVYDDVSVVVKAKTASVTATTSKVGPLVITTTVYRNQETVLAIAEGQELGGLSINEYGLYDYSITSTAVSSGSGASYTYYSNTWTANLSSYKYVTKTDSDKNTYLVPVLSVVKMVSKKWRYDVVINIHPSMAAAASIINGASEGSSISSIGNGAWMSRRVIKRAVSA